MNEQYEKFAKEMFEKYKSILFIEKYNLYLKYDNEKYLTSKFHYPYLNLTISYSDKSLKNWEKDKIDAEHELVHEFVHAITDPFYYLANNRYVSSDEVERERERLTDHIAKIVSKKITPNL
jgi:hypothetical protein